MGIYVASAQFRGVRSEIGGKRWLARVVVDGKQKYCGTHATERQAAHARDKVTYKAHGENADIQLPELLTDKIKAELDGKTLEELLEELKKAGEVWSRGSSTYRGAWFDKVNQKWRASWMEKKGKRKSKICCSEVDAARHYDRQQVRLRGKNAKLNFTMEDYRLVDGSAGVHAGPDAAAMLAGAAAADLVREGPSEEGSSDSGAEVVPKAGKQQLAAQRRRAGPGAAAAAAAVGPSRAAASVTKGSSGQAYSYYSDGEESEDYSSDEEMREACNGSSSKGLPTPAQPPTLAQLEARYHSDPDNFYTSSGYDSHSSYCTKTEEEEEAAEIEAWAGAEDWAAAGKDRGAALVQRARREQREELHNMWREGTSKYQRVESPEPFVRTDKQSYLLDIAKWAGRRHLRVEKLMQWQEGQERSVTNPDGSLNLDNSKRLYHDNWPLFHERLSKMEDPARRDAFIVAISALHRTFGPEPSASFFSESHDEVLAAALDAEEEQRYHKATGLPEVWDREERKQLLGEIFGVRPPPASTLAQLRGVQEVQQAQVAMALAALDAEEDRNRDMAAAGAGQQGMAVAAASTAQPLLGALPHGLAQRSAGAMPALAPGPPPAVAIAATAAATSLPPLELDLQEMFDSMLKEKSSEITGLTTQLRGLERKLYQDTEGLGFAKRCAEWEGRVTAGLMAHNHAWLHNVLGEDWVTIVLEPVIFGEHRRPPLADDPLIDYKGMLDQGKELEWRWERACVQEDVHFMQHMWLFHGCDAPAQGFAARPSQWEGSAQEGWAPRPRVAPEPAPALAPQPTKVDTLGADDLAFLASMREGGGAGTSVMHSDRRSRRGQEKQEKQEQQQQE